MQFASTKIIQKQPKFIWNEEEFHIFWLLGQQQFQNLKSEFAVYAV